MGLLPVGGASGAQQPAVGKNRAIPYRRLKGDYCGIGLGSLVTCRHHPSVFKVLLPKAGPRIPVPGASSRAVLPPDNTAQIQRKTNSV